MNKNVKTALVVVGVALAAFLLLSWTKKPVDATTTTQLSEAEKEALFADARGMMGGAAPSPEIEEQRRQIVEEARQKIKQLGLDSEFAAYLKARENEALPV